MSTSLRIVLTIAIAAALCGPAAAADGPLARLFRPRTAKSAEVHNQQQVSPQQFPPHIPQARSDRESLNEYYRQMYPKYYGGFHSRTLLNYGYAPGDIGFRGGLTYPGMPW
jgi:hypothetical protein